MKSGLPSMLSLSFPNADPSEMFDMSSRWMGIERRRPILGRRLRVAPRKSKLRYSAIDDQFRSGHEGGILAREEQRCLSDFPGLAETMKRDLILNCRGRFVELFRNEVVTTMLPPLANNGAAF